MLPRSAVAVALFGVTIGATRFLSRFRRPGQSFLSSLGLGKCSPPVARKANETVYYGVHPDKPDEFRGKNAMDPPKQVQDPYFWMRDDDRKRVEVIEHLDAENAYCAQSMKSLSPLQDELYDEMIGHMKETDEEIPYAHGNYTYYTRTEKGQSYKIHCRKLKAAEDGSTPAGREEIVLDENKIAEGQAYSVVGALAISHCHNYVAYSVDNTGYETYTIRVKDLTTGDMLDDIVEDTSGDIEWGKGSLFYLKQDAEHRPHELWVHSIPALNGGACKEDVMIVREDDALYWMHMETTHDEKFLVLSVASKETSEQSLLDLQHTDPADYSTSFVMVAEREFGHKYECEHHFGKLLITTNKDEAKNFKLCQAILYGPKSLAKDIKKAHWKEVRPYDEAVQIDDVLPFTHRLVVSGRQHGLPQLWVVDAKKNMHEWKQISFSECAYTVNTANNAEYHTDKLRFIYTSPITPAQTVEYDMKTHTSVVLKQQEVPGFDLDMYEMRRVFATAGDGTQVPVSMVAKKGIMPANNSDITGDGNTPLLLVAYGSYGMSYDVYFSFKALPLLDRGVIMATAGIRGGGEMGKHWHEDEGRYLTKINTFSDFADTAKWLIKKGYTSSDRLGITGRSAGGMLMGAVVNRDPGLYKAVIAGVPFVDVMCTMCDPSIPLTVVEWEEWGNPNEEKYHDYMMSYSPVDNVSSQDYPAMLITSGLNDPRVAYWEPTKWVAKMRELRTNSDETAPIYLKTEMSSGHFSFSDRYKHVKETAFEYAFLLDQLGLNKGNK